MVYPFLAGSTLLRIQRTVLPPSFCRYKSITAAIERGRQGGPGRPSTSRRRTSVAEARNDGDTRLKTRREARFERFGPPRDDPPPKAREERVAPPRSSRFGRVGPARARDDAPSRFNEHQPRRGERFGSGQHRDVDRGRTFNGRHARSTDSFPERKRQSDHQEPDRRPHSERFQDRDERTASSQRPSYGRDDAAPSKRDFDRPRGNRLEQGGRDQTSAYAPRQRETVDERPREPRFSHRPDSKGARRESESRYSKTNEAETPKPAVRGPESLPYTTAASEFIYGHSSVLAAIKANRRKLYNVYVHARGANRDGLLARIRAQKLFSITQEAGDEYLRAMDKASNGRPHNGVILEASPLPVPPITELRTASIEDESFSVSLDSQSAEDVLVNGKQEVYAYKSSGWRHPFILYVDGVLDEGNLGAIARSAYFLGVDAIITPTRQTAPWSHIALKASAGAAEAIPIFKVGEPADFLGKSSRAGWRIYASDAVPPAPSVSDSTSDTPSDTDGKMVYTIARSRKRLPVHHCPVAEHPTILMMGAEGTGLRSSLLNLAHYQVGIPHGREVNEIGVDSLNVSVAASLLCYEMLQKTKTPAAKSAEEVLF